MSSTDKKHTGVKYLMEKKKNEENEGYYGWFSVTQKKMRNDVKDVHDTKRPISNIYRDFVGNEVEITCVSKYKEYDKNSPITDLKFVGRVKEWVRGVYY